LRACATPFALLLQVALFEGVCYTTPIIGALLADSLWGRYKTIFVFSTIYLLVGPRPPWS